MRLISGSGYTALHIDCINGENIVTGCMTSIETGVRNVIFLSRKDPTSIINYLNHQLVDMTLSVTMDCAK